MLKDQFSIGWMHGKSVAFQVLSLIVVAPLIGLFVLEVGFFDWLLGDGVA